MDMFYNCNSLLIPPSINNINNTSNYCFNSMFESCNKLLYYQDLNTSSINIRSYYDMFYKCNKLLYPPSLNSNVANERSCSYMFASCSSLTYIPPLLMNEIDIYSCQYMFSNCKNVIGKNVYFNVSKLKTGCCQYMLRNVPISGLVVKFT